MLQLTLTVIVVFEIVSKTTDEDEKTTIVAVQLMIDQVITQLINTFRTAFSARESFPIFLNIIQCIVHKKLLFLNLKKYFP